MDAQTYVVGVDLGQAQDYTAIAVIEKATRYNVPDNFDRDSRIALPMHKGVRSIQPQGPDTYAVRHLERPALRTPYPAIVERVKLLLTNEPLAGNVELVADATGVGRAVIDLLAAAELPVIAVTITAGNDVSNDSGGYRVPKRDLVGILTILFQSGRLQVAKDLPLAGVLVDELINFRAKINAATAHDSYEAWREGVHDDLVLAVALACWFGEQCGPVRLPKTGEWWWEAETEGDDYY